MNGPVQRARYMTLEAIAPLSDGPTVSLPTISKSPRIGSLLVTETMRHEPATCASHASATATWTDTVTILWFAGRRTLGDAVTREMRGGVLSTTMTVPLQVLDAFPEGSVAARLASVEPRPNGPAGDWARVTGSPSASEEPSSIDAAPRQVAASADTVTLRQRAVGALSQRNWQKSQTVVEIARPTLTK